MSDNTEKREVPENPAIPEVFLKPYDPKETEEALYAKWEDSGFFNPDVCIERGVTDKDAETFSMVLPPPNVTGTLHMGSALMIAIEDILVRHARMNGKKTLWIPGTDSAAIATQAKVEKDIQKSEGKTRHDLGREELLKRIDAFVEESKSTIISQMRSMGASLDWSRYAYTMDDTRYRAVMEAFIRMYNAGLIYRGNRIVNWDPKGQTTISDDEIVYEERKAKLYTFKYSKDFPISISTTRPETKVGDTAVAVHPDDERYKEFVGKEYDVVFCDVPLHIKIVADLSVEKEFGTGALGVTPAHSQIDWEIADRHNLTNRPQVINEYAKMMVSGRLNGMKVGEAREGVVAWLREENLLESEEEVNQNVSTAERTGGIIEPLPKLQWWIDVEKSFTVQNSEIPGIASGEQVSLKELMLKTAEHGGVKFVTERFEKTYMNWAKNLRPWCISRQIWFGHQLPAGWDITDPGNTDGMLHYRKGKVFDLFDTYANKFADWNQDALKNSEPLPIWAEFNGVRIINFAMADLLNKRENISWEIIKEDAELKAQNLPSNSVIVKSDAFVSNSSIIQDPDVLDTWFSSGLWTFSTLGWPNETADLKNYHSTTLIETGYDIIFFWVARMILMSGFFLGQVPFKTVYLHGLVRDGQGRKISKSLGNNIDPVDMAEKYGMDAVRISLIAGMAPGTDSRISEDKIRGYKHFANKLWNITRFVLTSIGSTETSKDSLTPTDSTLIAELDALTKAVDEHFKTYRIDLASDAIYQYLWKRFADEIIEESKPILSGGDAEAIKSRQYVLLTILTTSLKLLHPFMPFVTEAIWQNMPKETKLGEPELLMVAKWPKG
ncbi:MAG: valine--tRNA ligase [Candidatus Kaiserbacteria bacterium]|nr:valine--tRNA ligase [Candidatus Kaiserbacteria bacterium]